MTDTEARRIHERIDDLVTEVGKVNTNVEKIKAACIPCQQRVDRISGTLKGNGTEGLVARVVRIEESRKHSSRLSGLITHAIAAIISGVVVGLIVAHFAG